MFSTEKGKQLVFVRLEFKLFLRGARCEVIALSLLWAGLTVYVILDCNVGRTNV